MNKLLQLNIKIKWFRQYFEGYCPQLNMDETNPNYTMKPRQ